MTSHETTRSENSFDIQYTLSGTGWAAARQKRREEPPGSNYETTLAMFYSDLLDTRVQFRYCGDLLFPPSGFRRIIEGGNSQRIQEGRPPHGVPPDEELVRGMPMSLLSLAWHLAQMMIEERFPDGPDGTEWSFATVEGGPALFFLKEGRQVAITSNTLWATLRVPDAEALPGITAFLHDFGHETQRHAPELLDWKVYDGVKRFM